MSGLKVFRKVFEIKPQKKKKNSDMVLEKCFVPPDNIAILVVFGVFALVVGEGVGGVKK